VPERHELHLTTSASLEPVLGSVMQRVRQGLDLDADPAAIDPVLAALPCVPRPGARMPGGFDGFETAARVILGQQVTVKAATTIAGRFVDTFGMPFTTPLAGLNRLSPGPERIAQAGVDEVARQGIPAARARSIIALARTHVSGELSLDAGAHHDPDDTITRLAALPGIGPWTAHYIAMRALRWPDAFPKEDMVVRKNLGGVTPNAAEALSQAWRPWRSYAVMHVWRMASEHAR